MYMVLRHKAREQVVLRRGGLGGVGGGGWGACVTGGRGGGYAV